MLEGMDGKVAIVTGAGRGLGRAEALELARLGARVVVNDYGRTLQGEEEKSPADAVVDEITAAGGEANSAELMSCSVAWHSETRFS